MKRYEFKYALNDLSLDRILDIITFHSAGFTEAYPQRTVNNFYLDTLSYNLFYQNIDGISKRRKFRYRWYGSFSADNIGQLEVKHKENELGWKKNIPIELAQISTKEKLIRHFEDTKLSAQYFEPKLYNQYKRYYFISSDQKFRLTVDYDQYFGLPYYNDKLFELKQKDRSLIVELKFDEPEFIHLNDITNSLPFLRTKNSKYSNGIQWLKSH